LISYSIDEVEKVLQTYTLEDILEYNGITKEDHLHMLVCDFGFEIPKPEPLCGDDASFAR